ncbi:MAG: anthranilate phosphoribosyltransferase [Candidatus Omnitrophota bacterium]
MREFIEKILNKENLTALEMERVMHEVMSGTATKDDLAAFLMALREKGPTVEEITGAARIMRKFVIPITTKHEVVLDTCGTGGDKTGTFNISTLTALVLAAAGVAVAKHGNRSVSSRCGSADILEGLGVNLNMSTGRLGECLDTIGIAFLFAQKLHPAMKHAACVRKELGVETIFNVLGPLTNPAMATHQMMGVYSRDLVEPMAKVLKNLGLKRAMVVHGNDGLDEATTTGDTFVSEYKGDGIQSYTISPAEVGIPLAKPEDLRGGDVETNVGIAEDILGGQKGPKRDIVVLNAACALYTAEVCPTISDGVVLACKTIDSGKARQKLEQLKEFSNRA